MTRKKAEKQILTRLKELTIPQEFIDWAFETLAEQSPNDMQTESEIRESLLNAIDDTEKQLSRLEDLYLKGTYDGEREKEYDSKQQKLIAKKKGFESRLANQNKRNDLEQEEKDLYSFAKNVLEWFSHGGFRTRIQILNSLGGKGKIRGGKIELTLDAVFIELKNTLDQVRVILPSFEPMNFSEFCLVEGNQAAVAAIKSTWLPEADKFRMLDWNRIKQELQFSGILDLFSTNALSV